MARWGHGCVCSWRVLVRYLFSVGERERGLSKFSLGDLGVWQPSGFLGLFQGALEEAGKGRGRLAWAFGAAGCGVVSVRRRVAGFAFSIFLK